MFESYAVGISLRLNDLVSAQLLKIGQEMTKLDGLVIGLNKSLKTTGAEAPAFKALASGLNLTANALGRAGRDAQTFERHLAAVIATSKGLAGMPGLPAGYGGRGGGGGGGAGGGGGGGAGRVAHGGNIHFGPGGIGLGTVGVAAGSAFIPLAIGAAGIYGAHAAYESAKDLDTERARFRLYGLSAAQNSEAFGFVDRMRVYGTSRAENMRGFREAQGVFRESGLSGSEALEGAKLAAPTLAKLDFLAKALGGESGAKMATANMAMLRYTELSGGLKSPALFNSLADFGYRLNASSGGTIDWGQLLAFKKTAASAGYNLSEDALARLEPIMAEMSGGRAGTALATAYGRLSGIVKLPNQVAQQLVTSGIWNRNAITWNAQGGVKSMNGNPLGEANTKLFHENPELFYERVIRPIYDKMKLSSDQIQHQNATIFGRTGGAFFNAIEQALPKINASVESLHKTLGIDAAMAEARKSMSGQEAEFVAAWTDFKSSAGTTLLPIFSSILHTGANLFRAGAGQPVDDAGPAARGMSLLRYGVGGLGRMAEGVSNFVGIGSKGNSGQLHATIKMPDGKVLAQVVTDFVGRDMARPQTGLSGFDGRMSLSPVTGAR